MVVDTSAVIAILFSEPEGPILRRVMAEAPSIRMSAANVVEAGLVALRAGGTEGADDLDLILEALDVEYIAVDTSQIRLARDALQHFGKGRHPAKLNLGDSFAYALAKHLDEPLLFKGDDFSQTDVKRAI